MFDSKLEILRALSILLSRLSLAFLTGRELGLFVNDLTEAVVICDDENFVLVAFKVMEPILESYKNSYKLLVMSLIFVRIVIFEKKALSVIFQICWTCWNLIFRRSRD